MPRRSINSGALPCYGLTLPILALGFGAALHTGQWHWFARSGAAVVALGIVLTSREIIERSRRMRWETHLHGTRCNHDWADDDSLRRLARARRRDQAIWESKFHGLYVLIIGTLTWGFGDLLGVLLAP